MASFKTLLLTLLVVYTSYFVFYKCEQADSSVVEETIDKVFHPLTTHHDKVCDAVHKSETFLKPYYIKTRQLLDDHVHSTYLFQKYDIHNKLLYVGTAIVHFVEPIATKLFELIEILESRVYGKVSSFF